MSGEHSIQGYIKDRRIWPLILIVVALIILDIHYGIHFGIEFVGGTQIPITLEHPVNVTAMSGLISALQQRVSTFGLKQITVEGVGDSHVYLTIPSISPAEINQTINIIQSQGKFDGVVNGKEAINGSDILKGSIGQLTPQQTNNSVVWTVTFFITQPASVQFSKVVFGQANQPLYMFLDRPSSTAMFISYSELGNTTLGLSAARSLAAMQSALKFGNQTIPVIGISNSNSSISGAEQFLLTNKGKYKQIIASANLNKTFLNFLQANNYTVKLESAQNMTPSYTRLSINQSIVQSWPVVGLLSSPLLTASITNGTTGQSYQISGVAPQTSTIQSQIAFANDQTKTIASILNGGALPVAIIAGTPTTIPPTLGQRFLYISGIIGLVAITLVSLFIVIRYRRIFLIAPILITTIVELFIIISVIGLVGTIDLSAIAGMIAVVGTGVDAQIIITDEMLTGTAENKSARLVLGNAFNIIWTDAALLIIAMLPLFFSTSLVTVVGFSESTIIGALLGILVTRPAYSAILSRHYSS